MDSRLRGNDSTLGQHVNDSNLDQHVNDSTKDQHVYDSILLRPHAIDVRSNSP